VLADAPGGDPEVVMMASGTEMTLVVAAARVQLDIREAA
jgi:hypothetical protein